jgi:hypothetical protein
VELAAAHCVPENKAENPLVVLNEAKNGVINKDYMSGALSSATPVFTTLSYSILYKIK